eukprot:644418-Rhodomonas_salina.1
MGRWLAQVGSGMYTGTCTPWAPLSVSGCTPWAATHAQTHQAHTDTEEGARERTPLPRKRA